MTGQVQIVDNEVAARRRRSGDPVSLPVDPRAGELARQSIGQWPPYRPTPLLALGKMAAQLGIERLWAKDEGERAPLGSFKALGGAYALGEIVRRHVRDRCGGSMPSYADLFAGRWLELASEIHATCASAGNHGRSLAWGARAYGARCTVYLAGNVSPAREAAIAAFGASTQRVKGSYDQAVARCARDAAQAGRVLVQDTSWRGYTGHCARIMSGYSILAEEALRQLPAGEQPSHVFLQVGCGGLAAAVTDLLWQRFGDGMPIVVLVQSSKAATLSRSFRLNAAAGIDGALDTAMTGIAVGRLSVLAWELLQQCGDFAVAIEDRDGVAAVRRLRAPAGADPAIGTTATGAAGIAAVMACCADGFARERLAIDFGSRILAVVTERGNDAF